MASFTLRPLYSLETRPRYLLDGRLGGPGAVSGMVAKVKKYSNSSTYIRTPAVQSAVSHFTA